MKNFVITAAVVACAGTAAASNLRTVAESSGNTFTATFNGESVHVGLLGFNNATSGESLDRAFFTTGAADGGLIRGGRQGDIVEVLNGVQQTNRSFDNGSGFASILDQLSSFQGLTFNADGRIFGAAVLVWRGSGNLVVSTSSGTSTFNSGGSLGDLGELAATPVPMPSASLMGLAGLGALAACRRRSA